jgi:hypothetical protein
LVDIEILDGPRQGGETIIDTFRERVFWNDPIVNRHNQCAEDRKLSIARREIVRPQPESPAVKADDQRKGGFHSLWSVQQHADLWRTSRSGDEAFLDTHPCPQGSRKFLTREWLDRADCHVDLLTDVCRNLVHPSGGSLTLLSRAGSLSVTTGRDTWPGRSARSPATGRKIDANSTSWHNDPARHATIRCVPGNITTT